MYCMSKTQSAELQNKPFYINLAFWNGSKVIPSELEVWVSWSDLETLICDIHAGYENGKIDGFAWYGIPCIRE